MNAMKPLLIPLSLVLLLGTLLGGCGFQLRGVTEVPAQLSPVFVAGAANSGIRTQLVQNLRNSGVTLAPAGPQARTTIRILQERQDDRVTAVNSQGKVIGSELQYRVRFDAVDGSGETLVKAQTINLAREYVNPEVEVIGKAEESVLIRQDMVQDMADRILRRLKAQLL